MARAGRHSGSRTRPGSTRSRPAKKRATCRRLWGTIGCAISSFRRLAMLTIPPLPMSLAAWLIST